MTTIGIRTKIQIRENILNFWLEQSTIFTICALIKHTNSGAQPEIFQGREGFVESGHFDKYFIKKHKEKRPCKENFGSFFS